MTAKFSSVVSKQLAEEFTKIALEQKLINHSSDAKESANNVVEYFNTIYDSFLTKNSD